MDRPMRVFDKGICTVGKYGMGDKVALIHGHLVITGTVLVSRLKGSGFFHNVAGYGWVAEDKILCSVKER